MGKLAKHKDLVSRTHKTLRGSTQLTGVTVIGGDFTVEGDLRARSPILCLGRVTVRGSVQAGVIVAGCGLEVDGDLQATDLKVYGGRMAAEHFDFDEVAREILSRLPKAWRRADELCMDHEHLVDEATYEELTAFEYMGDETLEVKGACTCEELFAGGGVDVGGPLIADEVDAFGSSVGAQEMTIFGSVACGSVLARRRVVVGEDLDCVDVDCEQLEVGGLATVQGTLQVSGADRRVSEDRDWWSAATPVQSIEAGHDPLENTAPDEVQPSLACGALQAGSVSSAGSIRVETAIQCTYYLRANRWILAGDSIETGKKYGIMAGVGVPRDRWLQTGYVCAAEKPKHLLTGVFRPLGRRRGLGVLKPAGLPRKRA